MLVTKKPCVRMRQLEDTGLGEKRGDNVIGHGILAGTYLAEYRDSLK